MANEFKRVKKTPDMVAGTREGASKDLIAEIQALAEDRESASQFTIDSPLPGPALAARIQGFKNKCKSAEKEVPGIKVVFGRADKPGATREEKSKATTATITFWVEDK